MNLYVGNLDFKASETDLKELFEKCGTVDSVKIITDKFSGRSKGFAFVTMENQAEAQQAIQELNGITLGTKAIIVNEARSRKTN